MLFGVLLALVVITAWVLRPGGDKGANARSSSSPPSRSATDATRSTSTHPGGSSAGGHAPPSTTGTASRSAGPAACRRAALKVKAVAGRATYRVGEQPMVLLQVTNVGAAPCVQDLADSQVELRVYNGESRVWGSHDCTMQPGTAERILAVGQPVRVSVRWSGLSSQPKCAGTRQRVGAGTYTLYALLSGREGTAAQFAIS
jgi:hypothetical protein